MAKAATSKGSERRTCGMTMIEPALAEWTAQRMRMSGCETTCENISSVEGIGVEGGRSKAHKVGQGDHVEHAPDERRLVADHLDAELPPSPRMRAVATDEVLGLDDLDSLVVRAVLLVQRLLLLGRQERAAEQAAARAGCVAGVAVRVRLVVREVTDRERDRVGVEVGHERLVDVERLGEHRALGDDGALRVFLRDVLESARRVSGSRKGK